MNLEIILNEKIAWQKLLGAKVEVKSLPPFTIDPDLLSRAGLNLFYLPHLQFGTRAEMTAPDFVFDDYLKWLQQIYPNWRLPDKLNYLQFEDPVISHNLDRTFWEALKAGEIPFPCLNGQWIAVDNKPVRRTVASWHDIDPQLELQKPHLLAAAGLPSGLEVRLPEIIEWDLLANRQGWAKPGSIEWTNTRSLDRDGAQRYIVGISRNRGPAYSIRRALAYESETLAYRRLIILGAGE